MLAEVEQGIVRCFREGGGLSYADYPRFHAVIAEDSAAIADIGCGSGHAINVLARAYPASRFTGFDFSEEAIAAGRAEGLHDRVARPRRRWPRHGLG